MHGILFKFLSFFFLVLFLSFLKEWQNKNLWQKRSWNAHSFLWITWRRREFLRVPLRLTTKDLLHYSYYMIVNIILFDFYLGGVFLLLLPTSLVLLDSFSTIYHPFYYFFFSYCYIFVNFPISHWLSQFGFEYLNLNRFYCQFHLIEV